MLRRPHRSLREHVDVRIATADRVRRILKREREDPTACLLARYLTATSHAFVWTPEPEVVYLAGAETPRDLIAALGHEALHITVNLLEGVAASRSIDRLPPRARDALDGAGRLRVRSRVARLLRTGATLPGRRRH